MWLEFGTHCRIEPALSSFAFSKSIQQLLCFSLRGGLCDFSCVVFKLFNYINYICDFSCVGCRWVGWIGKKKYYDIKSNMFVYISGVILLTAT